jgi:hypothetical protein
MRDPLNQKPIHRYPRSIGVLILAVSAAVMKWQIYDPLHAAEQGKQTVLIWGTLFCLSIMAGVFGLALIVFGKSLGPWIEAHPEYLGRRKPYLPAFTILIIMLYAWVLHGVSKQGYSSNPGTKLMEEFNKSRWKIEN